MTSPTDSPWTPAQRFPDPAVRILDDRFRDYVVVLAKVERLTTGCRWSEGPVWFGDHRCLIWSDIPGDRLMRWDEQSNSASVFRQPANFANGNARDTHGRLVSCEHGGRRVVRTEYDGSITVLADRYDGKPLNSPNDVVVASDGSVWFTDPAFGISGDYEGHRADPELPTNIYRVDPDTLEITCAADDVRSPNGLAFSPDERLLYVVQSRAVPRRNIVVYDVVGPALKNQRVLIDAEDGIPDGMCVDEDGNLWCGWGMGTPELDGVRVFDPNGVALGHISLPERCANVTFGGRFLNRLFMAAGSSLYALHVNTRGAR
ncbi:MAG: SMP-30/gluconolactonase/LRE family protein [Actinomycetota bacterium]